MTTTNSVTGQELGFSSSQLSGKYYTKVKFDNHLRDLIVDNDGQQYRFEKYLGGGFEGEVWKVCCLETKQMYALKFEIGDVDIGKQLSDEFKCLSSFHHSSIIKPIKYWLGSILSDSYPRGHMLTELIEGQTIHEYKLDNIEIKAFMLELVRTVKYLNITEKKVHGDLDLGNIMINSSKSPILIDFGFMYDLNRGNTDMTYYDLRCLGLIYLHLLGLNSDLISTFKQQIGWYQKHVIQVSERMIDQILPDLNKSEKLILLAFLNLNHDEIIEALNN